MSSHGTHSPSRPRGQSSPTTRRVGGTYPRRSSLTLAISEDPQPPSPHLTSPEDVQISVVMKALFFCKFRRNHRLTTPRSRTFYEQLETVSKKCMDEPECRDHKIAFITLNNTLHSAAFLSKQSTTEERLAGSLKTTRENLTEALRKIAEQKYFSDYGDYVAAICTNFRQDCSEQGVADQDRFSSHKTWQMINDGLRFEDRIHRAWEKNNMADREPEMPTTMAIYNACTNLGADYNHMRFAIDWYAKRNHSSHNSVSYFIKQAMWTDLGNQLLIDLPQVPSIFGEEDRIKMTKVLEDLRDRYFTYLGPDAKVESQFAKGITQKKDTKIMAKVELDRKACRKTSQGCREASQGGGESSQGC
ncbi:MAG: hypothetical protein Q9183_004415 [Haloplaca sp. 2 TL-2023]